MASGERLNPGLDMVCGMRHGLVRDCGLKSHSALETQSVGGNMNDFLKGVITGAAGMLLLVLLVLVFRFFQERDRKIYEYMEAQNEIKALQEDIGNRPLDEFLDDPGVRGAADSADAEFRRKRDEAVRAIRRSRIAR
jgi:hypothetical protein